MLLLMLALTGRYWTFGLTLTDSATGAFWLVGGRRRLLIDEETHQMTSAHNYPSFRVTTSSRRRRDDGRRKNAFFLRPRVCVCVCFSSVPVAISVATLIGGPSVPSRARSSQGRAQVRRVWVKFPLDTVRFG